MGIDGQISALVGESLVNPEKLHFGAVGDLTFFYDMNSLGNRQTLIKHYVEDLGFEYLTASTKEEFCEAMKRFTIPVLTEHSMVFEVFTDSKDESDGIYAMNHIVSNLSGKTKDKAKEFIKSIAGEKGLSKIKGILGK